MNEKRNGGDLALLHLRCLGLLRTIRREYWFRSGGYDIIFDVIQLDCFLHERDQ
jgi:hypothetical protein